MPADVDFPLALSNHALRHSGGFERYAMTLVRGLHALGIRPTFIAKSFDEELPEYDWVTPVRLRMTGVPGKLRDLWFDRGIGRVKRRSAIGPLIACNPTRWADIAVCGGTHPGYLAAMGLRTRLSDRWKIALERAHYERSQIIVAHSAKMRAEIIAYYGADPAKVVLLYPPCDTDRFHPVDAAAHAELRQALGLPNDRAIFLLASTGHARKGLDALAEFFSRTTLPVTLVGRPPQRQHTNVRYLGYRTDIENVYRAVDFTVMASAYEPFGLVGVESVLCGTPVLLAQGVGCVEVIRGPAVHEYDGTSSTALAHAVQAAVQQWQAGTHRLREPLRCLAYDPRVATHVEALLALARTLSTATSTNAGTCPAKALPPS